MITDGGGRFCSPGSEAGTTLCSGFPGMAEENLAGSVWPEGDLWAHYYPIQVCFSD